MNVAANDANEFFHAFSQIYFNKKPSKWCFKTISKKHSTALNYLFEDDDFIRIPMILDSKL